MYVSITITYMRGRAAARPPRGERATARPPRWEDSDPQQAASRRRPAAKPLGRSPIFPISGGWVALVHFSERFERASGADELADDGVLGLH